MSNSKEEQNFDGGKRKTTENLPYPKGEKKQKDATTAAKNTMENISSEISPFVYIDESRPLSSSSSSSESKTTHLQNHLSAAANFIAIDDLSSFMQTLLMLESKAIALETVILTGAFEQRTLLEVALIVENEAVVNLLFEGVSITQQIKLLDKIKLPDSLLLLRLKNNLKVENSSDQNGLDFDLETYNSFSQMDSEKAESKGKSEKSEEEEMGDFSSVNLSSFLFTKHADVLSSSFPTLILKNKVESKAEDESEKECEKPTSNFDNGSDLMFSPIADLDHNSYEGILLNATLDYEDKITFIKDHLSHLNLDLAISIHTKICDAYKAPEYQVVINSIGAYLGQRMQDEHQQPSSSSTSSSSNSTYPGSNMYSQFSSPPPKTSSTSQNSAPGFNKG